MSTGITEERIAALEAEVARIKSQLQTNNAPEGERYGVIGHSNFERISEMFGQSAGDPLSEEVSQGIETEREREREAARQALKDTGK